MTDKQEENLIKSMKAIKTKLERYKPEMGITNYKQLSTELDNVIDMIHGIIQCDD